jgi:hypothetical protein
MSQGRPGRYTQRQPRRVAPRYGHPTPRSHVKRGRRRGSTPLRRSSRNATTRRADLEGCRARVRFAFLLDEVLNLEDFWFHRELDPHLGEDGHELLTVRLELLAGTPNLADGQVVLRAEEDVEIKTGRIRLDPCLLHTPQAFVVLLLRDVRGTETHNDAHGAVLLVG